MRKDRIRPVTMKFYDALQLDPAILKRRIAACDTRREKEYYWLAMAVRSVLIVAFAIVFISLLSALFSADNTPLAVALFCMMLGIRFVNFEYCIGDSLVTLAAVLAILVFVPCAAAVLPPILLIPLHFAAFFGLLCMTTQRPEMGNGGLYSFAYVYLTGNPVAGEALVRRCLLALVGYLICAAILFFKHRHQHRDTRFHHVVRRFDLSSPLHLWQIRMSLGGEPGAHCRTGFWGGAVHVDGLCLCLPAVRVPLLRQHLLPLLPANRGRDRRVGRLLPPLPHYPGCPPSPHGPAWRTLPGLLRGLPV